MSPSRLSVLALPLALVPALLPVLSGSTMGLVAAQAQAQEAAGSEAATQLRRALDAAQGGDWDGAQAIARSAGPLVSDIIAWQRLRAKQGDFGEYVGFLARRADWPGLPLLHDRGEAVIPDAADPARVVAYFAKGAPATGAGALALVNALEAQGKRDRAGAEAVLAWRNLKLTEAQQATFLARYGTALAPEHGGRMQNMLDAGNLADARRMLDLVTPGTRAVAEARIALQAGTPGVDGLLAAVPDYMQGSTGLAYDRFMWRIHKDLYDSAADLLLERSVSAETLGDPHRWANWRGILARREMRLGRDANAYRLATTHQLDEGSDYADLEWLAGYIALRRLDDPAAALRHFGRFQSAVTSPISLGRAGYWQGRAFEALGRQPEANAAYSFGALYQTSFYGLLSAEKLGRPLDPALTAPESFGDWRGAGFTQSPVFRAAELLYAADAPDQGERFLLHLGERLSTDDLGLLAGYALEKDRPHLALMVAKAAAARGVVLPAAYFPMNGLEKMDLPVPAELALSIARRESEFDPAVISHAGARGLMQVMPATAKRMAGKVGIAYEQARLTTDWRYNAQLGSAYLAQLIDEFGNAPALVAAGYNAGPGRPRQWIRDYGDPRSADVDIVDWIESIPYTETQNYVMRVAETLPVYRARLTGRTGPVDLTDELRGELPLR